MLTGLTKQLQKTIPLSDENVAAAVLSLVDESVPVVEKAEFLTALARKGESIQEIAAFARELRERAVQPPIDPVTRQQDIVDVCGTGGDRLNTFNISTAVAILVAAAGVPVAKHGNRAITSQSGSADVLEALHIPIDLSPEQAAQSLRERQFAFFFAPRYHPSFKHIAGARRLCAERGQRTIFNFLGPLLNPARPSAQLIGVPAAEMCEPIGRVLQSLGMRRGMVVSGRVGERWLDELSTFGENMIAEFYQERAFSAGLMTAAMFACQPARLDDLVGGDREVNAQIIQRLLRGEERGPKRDALLLNTAAALFVAGRAESLLDGWKAAADLIDSGRAQTKLEDLRQT